MASQPLATFSSCHEFASPIDQSWCSSAVSRLTTRTRVVPIALSAMDLRGSYVQGKKIEITGFQEGTRKFQSASTSYPSMRTAIDRWIASNEITNVLSPLRDTDRKSTRLNSS